MTCVILIYRMWDNIKFRLIVADISINETQVSGTMYILFRYQRKTARDVTECE